MEEIWQRFFFCDKVWKIGLGSEFGLIIAWNHMVGADQVLGKATIVFPASRRSRSWLAHTRMLKHVFRCGKRLYDRLGFRGGAGFGSTIQIRVAVRVCVRQTVAICQLKTRDWHGQLSGRDHARRLRTSGVQLSFSKTWDCWKRRTVLMAKLLSKSVGRQARITLSIENVAGALILVRVRVNLRRSQRWSGRQRRLNDRRGLLKWSRGHVKQQRENAKKNRRQDAEEQRDQ